MLKMPRKSTATTGSSSSTSATCVLTAGRGVYAPAQTISSRKMIDCDHCWPCTIRNSCTRIRRQCSLHSCYGCTGRCRGHTWWTSFYLARWAHHRRYPSTLIPVACSCMPRWGQRTSCTRRSTSWSWYVPEDQISACSGRCVSADAAVHCQASSFLSCRWIRL